MSVEFARAGLELDLPLDSAVLRGEETEELLLASEIELTDASDGFFAEALGIKSSRTMLFPEYERFFCEKQEKTHAESTVSARVYPPQGRHVLGVNDLTLTRVFDRKGRSLETPEKTAFSVEFSLAQFSSRQIGTRADFSFQVPMPPESPMSLL